MTYLTGLQILPWSMKVLTEPSDQEDMITIPQGYYVLPGQLPSKRGYPEKGQGEKLCDIQWK